MNKSHRFVAIITFILFMVGCTLSKQPENTQYFTSVDYLLFAGKVVNENTGEWANNRLVILFLKNNEVARAITSTRAYYIGKPKNKGLMGSNGVTDGVFYTVVPNTYQLTLNTLGIPPSELPLYEGIYYPDGKNANSGRNALASWLDPIYEGSQKEFYIPSKNIKYTLVALSGDVSQLPSEIQQPGSIRIIEGNRLVLIDPNAPDVENTSPTFANNTTKFDQITEQVNVSPPLIFPINNCGGSAEVKQEVTQTYIHEIVDESKFKLGIEIPILDWFKIVAEIEKRYGISDKQITSFSTTLTVPAGQNIQYTLVRKETWESGSVSVIDNNIEISAPYRILLNEIIEIANSENKPCP